MRPRLFLRDADALADGDGRAGEIPGVTPGENKNIGIPFQIMTY
jgi:hypothetical protein